MFTTLRGVVAYPDAIVATTKADIFAVYCNYSSDPVIYLSDFVRMIGARIRLYGCGREWMDKHEQKIFGNVLDLWLW